MTLHTKFVSNYGSYHLLRYGYWDEYGWYFGPVESNSQDAKNQYAILSTARSNTQNSGYGSVLAFLPTHCHHEISIEAICEFHQMTLIGNKTNVYFTFKDDATILIKGTGDDAGLIIDLKPTGFMDSIVELKNQQGQYFIASCYRMKTKYLIYATTGTIHLHQNHYGDEYSSNLKLESYLEIDAIDGEYNIVIQEIEHNISKVDLTAYDYEASAHQLLHDFYTFYNQFEKPSQKYEETYLLSVYYHWALVQKPGTITKRNMIANCNMIHQNWSADICFSSIGLAKAHPQLAYDSLMVFFDLQDELGCIPGSTTETSSNWNNLKAPLQGHYLKYILQYFHPTQNQTLELYTRLSQYVSFWLNYRDSNHDGICEYMHGNESDADNASCFEEFVAYDSPDLTAYLITDMDLLSNLAIQLGLHNEALEWQSKSHDLCQKALKYFIVDDQIVLRKTLTGEIVETQCFLIYYLLLLGDRLPKNIIQKSVETLQHNFLSQYGMATEALNSSQFSNDGFRGPTNFIITGIIDALSHLGYKDLAKEFATRFCNGLKESHSFELFDVITGKACHGNSTNLVNSSICGAFIYLYNEYVRK